MALQMKSAWTFIFLGLLVQISFSTKGIDLSSLCSGYSCLKQSYSFAIPRAWCSYGAADANAPANIKNAKAAGFQYVDVYMFPCRSKGAAQQVNALVDYLNDHLYGNGTMKAEPMQENDINAKGLMAGSLKYEKQDLQPYNNATFLQDILIKSKTPQWKKPLELNQMYGQIWLDIEINPSCGWGTNYASNCQYLQELINAVKARGIVPGVYSSIYMWETIMGSQGACASAASGVPLWYAHYDNSPSFSDYSKIGGWSSPNIKQYVGDTTSCGYGVDLNYY